MSNETLPFPRTVCSKKQESLPIMDSSEEEEVGRQGGREGVHKLSLNSFWKYHSHREAENKWRFCEAGVCSRPAESFFRRSVHCRKKNTARYEISTFSIATPSPSLPSPASLLSITTFQRGFLRAHHIEKSRALLYMAHPGMEPLWSRWAYSHSIPLEGNLQGLRKPDGVLRDCGGVRRSGRVLIEGIAGNIEAKRAMSQTRGRVFVTQ